MSRSSCVESRLFVAWNIDTVVFLPNFFLVFLFVLMLLTLLLGAVINLSSLFFIVVLDSLHWWTDAIFNVGDTSSSFSWHTLSVSFLGCKAFLCMIISFLVLCFICLSSSLVYCKNGPENLIRAGGCALVFIPLIRFLLQSLVLRN